MKITTTIPQNNRIFADLANAIEALKKFYTKVKQTSYITQSKYGIDTNVDCEDVFLKNLSKIEERKAIQKSEYVILTESEIPFDSSECLLIRATSKGLFDLKEKKKISSVEPKKIF